VILQHEQDQAAAHPEIVQRDPERLEDELPGKQNEHGHHEGRRHGPHEQPAPIGRRKAFGHRDEKRQNAGQIDRHEQWQKRF